MKRLFPFLLATLFFAVPVQGQSLHATFSASTIDNPDPALGMTYNHTPEVLGYSASAYYAGARQSLQVGPSLGLSQDADAFLELGVTRAEEHTGIGFQSSTAYPVSATVGARYQVNSTSLIIGVQYLSKYDLGNGFSEVTFPQGLRVMFGAGSVF